MKTEMPFASFTYSEHNWPELAAEKLKIDTANRKIVIDTKDERMIRKCTESDWLKLEKYVAACKFSAWEKEYFEPVLDGTTWDIEIVNSDGNTMESHGCNGYPVEWKQFLALKRFCHRLMKKDD
jgi:hypothetical protein